MTPRPPFFLGAPDVPFVLHSAEFLTLLSALRCADPATHPDAGALSGRLQASYEARELARLEDRCPASPRGLLILRAENPHIASVVDLLDADAEA